MAEDEHTSPFPILTTDRLLLRAFDPKLHTDYETVVSFIASPWASRITRSSGITSPEHIDIRCARYPPRPKDWPDSKPFPTHPFHLIYLRSNPDAGIIGFTTLFLRKPLPSPDLGYMIHEKHAGQGYATEASRAVLKWWDEDMGIRDIWIGTFDDNVPSQKVAQKLGFEDGGRVKFVLSVGNEREGEAWVQKGKDGREGLGRKLDGFVVDVRNVGQTPSERDS